MRILLLKLLRVCCLVILAACVICEGQQAGTFDGYIKEARALLKEGNFAEGKAKADAAAKLEPKRYEPYAVLALIAAEQGDHEAAKGAVDRALQLAPTEKKASLEALQKKLADAGPEPASSRATQAPKPKQQEMTPEARRQLDVLLLIIEDADKSKTAAERRKLLVEALEKSGSFVQNNPNSMNVWLLRAAIALEFDNTSVGWEAGRKLISLGAENDESPKTRKVLAALERRGWLSEKQPEIAIPPSGNERWTNSLGMIFVPIDGVGGMFSIWVTRVQDFRQFVDDTGYNEVGDMISLESDGVGKHGRTWKNPGFSQTDEHPVVGVSFDDANAFCRWLSEKEERAGILRKGQYYRLPKYNDLEWNKAWGKDIPRNAVTGPDGSVKIIATFPWGTEWPPPAGIGNLPGIEAKDSTWPKNLPIIQGYFDPYPRTSPVGKFEPNKFGLYDMIGNVAQIMGDEEYHVVGYSWRTPLKPMDFFSGRYLEPPGRSDCNGFRCVLVTFDQQEALKWDQRVKAEKEAAKRKFEEEGRKEQAEAAKQARLSKEQEEAAAAQEKAKAKGAADEEASRALGRWQFDRDKSSGKGSGNIELVKDGLGNFSCRGNFECKSGYDRLTGRMDTTIYPIFDDQTSAPSKTRCWVRGSFSYQYKSDPVIKREWAILMFPSSWAGATDPDVSINFEGGKWQKQWLGEVKEEVRIPMRIFFKPSGH